MKKAPKNKSEQAIKNEILEFLNRVPGGLFFVHDSVGIFNPKKGVFFRRNSKFHRKGVSDIIGVLGGRGIAIEVKSKIGKLSWDQKIFLAQWHESGGRYCVARSVDDVRKFIADLINE